MKSILQTKKVGLLFALMSLSVTSLAQVPPFVTYQGVLQSGGQNFTGTGFFKFAIIDGVTQPTASPQFISGGAMTGATVIDGGAGYVAPPAVTVSDPTGSGADLTAVLAGGSIVNISVNSGGAGYTDPTIHIAPPSENSSLWSNDGTVGGEPTTAVEVEVEKGVFTVVLGQDMTPLNPSIFDHPGLYLRQWFSDDDQSSFVQWSDDIHLTSVPYAMIAAQVAGGAITGDQIADAAIGSSALAPNSVNSGHIIDGEVNTEDLADDAVTSEKLANSIDLGSAGASGGLDVWDGPNDVRAIMLNGPHHTISMSGSDGLERIGLRFDSYGQLRLHDTEQANLTAWLTAGNDNLVLPQLLLNSSGGDKRAHLLSAAGGGTLGLFTDRTDDSDNGLRALLECGEADGEHVLGGGRLTLYQDDGDSGAILNGQGDTGGGTLSLRDANGDSRAQIHGGAAGTMYLYAVDGSVGVSLVGENLNAGNSEGGQLTVHQADGQAGAVLYGEESTGVGMLSLRNDNGNARALLFGGPHGRMELRNNTGDSRLELYGGTSTGSLWLRNDQGNGNVVLVSDQTNGVVSVRNEDGAQTVYLWGRNSDASGGGQIGIANDAGEQTITLNASHNGEGRITTEVLAITGGSDLSEQFNVNPAGHTLEPGMVVCIDAENAGELRVSTGAYDPTVAGVVSGAGGIKPGMLMGQSGTVAHGEHPIALTGRVFCKVDASYGAIKPGDLITTSDTLGHGMKVTDPTRAHGAIVGKAMTGLESGRGLVLVLVSLH